MHLCSCFSYAEKTNAYNLHRDPKARPSAKDALQDPWLKGNSIERNQGKPIDLTVVQRIQVGLCRLCTASGLCQAVPQAISPRSPWVILDTRPDPESIH